MQRRGEGVGHLYAALRLVAAVVGDDALARVEEQRQIDARQQQDDEAVERELAENERPVVRKDLVHAALEEVRRHELVVDVLQGSAGGFLGRSLILGTNRSRSTVGVSLLRAHLSALPEARPDGV